MNPKLIVINGKTYNSVDEIPVAFESMNILADKDRDGVPDVFENMSSNVVVSGNMKIIVDGKEFNSLADLPADVRARYEQAMGKLDANQNGLPDFLEGMITTPIQTPNVETSFGTETPRRSRCDGMDGISSLIISV